MLEHYPNPNTERSPSSYVDLSGLSSAEKIDTLTQLRHDEPDLYVLHNAAWQVLGDAFYGSDSPEPAPIRQAGELLKKVGDDPELPDKNYFLHFDSLLAHSTLPFFKDIAHGRSTQRKTRISVRNAIGGLIKQAAGPAPVHIESLPPFKVRKVVEALTIGLVAQDYRDPTSIAVPSMPYTHSINHIDPDTNTTQFHLYILSKGLTIPTWTSRVVNEKVYKARYYGVYPLILGEAAVRRLTKFPDISDESRKQPSLRQAQTWLVNRLADTFIDLATPNTQAPESFLGLAGATGAFIAENAAAYNPDGLNRPPKSRARLRRP